MSVKTNKNEQKQKRIHRLALNVDGRPRNPFPHPAIVFRGDGGGLRYQCSTFRSGEFPSEVLLRQDVADRFPYAAIEGGGVIRDGK